MVARRPVDDEPAPAPRRRPATAPRAKAPPPPPPAETAAARFARAVTDARDALLLIAGLAGIAYVTLTRQPDPALLALFAGMIGLPAVLRHDERRR